MNKSRINLLYFSVFLAIMSVLSLTGCSGNQLSSDFNEEDVKKAAENVILLINNEDSESLREIFNTPLNEALTDDVLKQVYDAIRAGGQFEKIESMSTLGTTDKTSNEEYAVVVAAAKYELKTFTYTLSFDKEMKLAGLYYK
jgi:hypothetical protein